MQSLKVNKLEGRSDIAQPTVNIIRTLLKTFSLILPKLYIANSYNLVAHLKMCFTNSLKVYLNFYVMNTKKSLKIQTSNIFFSLYISLNCRHQPFAESVEGVKC